MQLKPAALLFLALLLSACNSTKEAEFASVAELAKSQYATQVPRWLPSSAKTLRLKANNSTHELILRFEFSRPQVFPPPAPSCKQTKRPLRVNPPLDASWWPGDVESPIASYLEIIYDCGTEGILLVRGLPEKTTAYYWR